MDTKLLETEFLIAICLATGDKWQSKTQFLVIFDPCFSIIKSFFDCRSVVKVQKGLKFLFCDLLDQKSCKE